MPYSGSLVVAISGSNARCLARPKVSNCNYKHYLNHHEKIGNRLPKFDRITRQQMIVPDPRTISFLPHRLTNEQLEIIIEAMIILRQRVA